MLKTDSKSQVKCNVKNSMHGHGWDAMLKTTCGHSWDVMLKTVCGHSWDAMLKTACGHRWDTILETAIRTYLGTGGMQSGK